jgi:hypothetical protein
MILKGLGYNSLFLKNAATVNISVDYLLLAANLNESFNGND